MWPPPCWLRCYVPQSAAGRPVEAVGDLGSALHRTDPTASAAEQPQDLGHRERRPASDRTTRGQVGSQRMDRIRVASAEATGWFGRPLITAVLRRERYRPRTATRAHAVWRGDNPSSHGCGRAARDHPGPPGSIGRPAHERARGTRQISTSIVLTPRGGQRSLPLCANGPL